MCHVCNCISRDSGPISKIGMDTIPFSRGYREEKAHEKLSISSDRLPRYIHIDSAGKDRYTPKTSR